MRVYCFLFLFILNLSVYAKEWKSLKIYHKTTHKENLLASDWLKSDRTNNTDVWKLANSFNLENNLSQEYNSFSERKDFYKWVQTEVEKKGHQVVWFKMVYFISRKLSLMEAFPSNVFANKKIMNYANSCSESIFKNSFIEINNLFKLTSILNEKAGLEWDKDILYKEQYIWVNEIINTMDARSLKKVENILQRKCLYGIFVPKELQFMGDLENKEMRYEYALNTLRIYFKNIKR
ncbi:Insecticidal toxin complex protein [Mariniflexile litorale]|uniref:Insecticidal toxin complex protein n=1 Tax=Mariniflexile litorale TaxID=3045158 RepID=A0AAU7EG15_9FLAO|nr:Insecticidal toxin complex protein [Mariniflexile sp. KMM 9835]MDQ8211703.1 Insecticidal toxin complex protein [Mariniflexile sp. KMM 9835]